MATKDYAETGKTLGILSIFFCWIPIVGLILGCIAMSKASSGKRHDPIKAKRANTLGIVGITFSIVFAIIYGVVTYNQYHPSQQCFTQAKGIYAGYGYCTPTSD